MKKIIFILAVVMTLSVTKTFATTTIEFYTAFTNNNCYGDGSACHIIITLPIIYPNDPSYPALIKQYGSNIPNGATILEIPAAQIGVLPNWQFQPLQTQFTGSDGKLHTYSLPLQQAPYDASIKSYIGYAVLVQ